MAIERFWLADWDALCEREGITRGGEDERLLAALVVSDIDAYPWTVVDIALTLVTCPECGQERSGGPASCATCTLTFQNLMAYDMEAGYQGVMTFNEHMIRVARTELRFPHRYPAHVAQTAKWLMPIGITNPTRVEPYKMQAIYAAFEAGTLTQDETKWDNDFEVIYQKAVHSTRRAE